MGSRPPRHRLHTCTTSLQVVDPAVGLGRHRPVFGFQSDHCRRPQFCNRLLVGVDRQLGIKFIELFSNVSEGADSRVRQRASDATQTALCRLRSAQRIGVGDRLPSGAPTRTSVPSAVALRDAVGHASRTGRGKSADGLGSVGVEVCLPERIRLPTRWVVAVALALVVGAVTVLLLVVAVTTGKLSARRYTARDVRCRPACGGFRTLIELGESGPCGGQTRIGSDARRRV